MRPVGRALLVLLLSAGCTPSMIIGPLSYQRDERDHLMARARAAGMSTDLLAKVAPPLTPEEQRTADDQDSSCRASYIWKNGFTYTGSVLVAAAAVSRSAAPMRRATPTRPNRSSA
jgi:hypothetical protein